MPRIHLLTHCDHSYIIIVSMNVWEFSVVWKLNKKQKKHAHWKRFYTPIESIYIYSSSVSKSKTVLRLRVECSCVFVCLDFLLKIPIKIKKKNCSTHEEMKCNKVGRKQSVASINKIEADVNWKLSRCAYLRNTPFKALANNDEKNPQETNYVVV